ncbi:MAG: DUF2335 domain-containing protein [Acidobacteriaceae bacterium]|nr:DUF2335 domain-containing protein [Acidobacteriaceae bacterium]
MTAVAHHSQSFMYSSGPLPPPDVLTQYDQVVPNGAERIMAMAEQQSRHRIELEPRLLTPTLPVRREARGSRLFYVWLRLRVVSFSFGKERALQAFHQSLEALHI